jgi:lysophospholipase L1-like esterase
MKQTPTFVPPAPGHAVVVGLGDSVPAGSACHCVDFVRLYARELPAVDGGPATARNLGKPGSTSADLLRSLHEHSAIARAVAGATIVLVTTGANDLGPVRRRHRRSGCGSDCWHDAVAQVGRNIAGIVDAIEHLRAGRSTLVLVTDYWNVFPDGSVARREFGEAYLRWSDRLTADSNAAICAGARSAGARCVDLYAPFKGNGGIDPTTLLAGDGDHPNARGHRLIARTLLAATPR